jgi:hypothetical protein
MILVMRHVFIREAFGKPVLELFIKLSISAEPKKTAFE